MIILVTSVLGSYRVCFYFHVTFRGFGDVTGAPNPAGPADRRQVSVLAASAAP